MVRNCRNQEKMFLIIEQWKESGMTQARFCEWQKIPKSTFYYWRKKHKEEKDTENSFIPITIKNGNNFSAFQNGITIHYPNGVQLTITSQLSAGYIRELVNIF
jgi:hypothetical protein